MATETVQEIVIVKRRGSLDADAHKGGVWKIAFADFMTAMMAFFLVLWLINAANKETRAAIASYFNPIRLVDSSPTRKGLRDGRDGDSGGTADKKTEVKTPGEQHKTAGPPRTAPPGASKTTFTETSLFEDPYAALAEIADREAKREETDLRGPPHLGARGPRPPSDAMFRDPFAPIAPEVGNIPRLSPRKTMDTGMPPTPKPSQPPGAARSTAPPPTSPKLDEVESPTVADDPELSKLREALAAVTPASARGGGPSVSVERTAGGILISLTDRFDVAMFELGSAQPTPRLVEVMAEIGKLLAKRQGGIVVRGHTDSRPFKSKVYDNWRLSAARAHMAHYMLVRGGLAEGRVEHVEGHADRTPKDKTNADAPVNRRIEILLRGSGP